MTLSPRFLLEPIFDKDVGALGYRGIRKLDYRDMAVDGLFFAQTVPPLISWTDETHHTHESGFSVRRCRT